MMKKLQMVPDFLFRLLKQNLITRFKSLDMKKNAIQYLLFILPVLAASCGITKTYQTPVVRTQGLYRDSSAADSTDIASLHWTEVFKDSLLQNLIREGISNNLNLKI